jgi:hypothetical protein
METFLGSKECLPSYLRFYEFREDGTKIDGVQNKEVLEVLVHRIKKLQEKFPCFENVRTIECLEAALVWDTIRTQDRNARGVEGKHAK